MAPENLPWSLTAERQPGTVGFRASYAGSRSVNLLYRRNLKQSPPNTTLFSGSRRPHAPCNHVIWTDNGANEFYNGLEVAATKKQGKYLTFGTGRAWACNLSDAQDSSGGRSSFGGQVIQDQFNRSVEEASNVLVLKQRAFGYAVYAPPFGRNQRFLS